MGRSRTPAYRIEYATRGPRVLTAATWRIRPEGPIPGEGRPTHERLKAHLAHLLLSLEPGGVNEHAGPLEVLAAAVIDQRTEHPVAIALSRLGERAGPFEAGWVVGHVAQVHLSPREVLELAPGYSHEEVDVFLNGLEDGVRNDTWRLERLKGA